jgi:hypothetical protein
MGFKGDWAVSWGEGIVWLAFVIVRKVLIGCCPRQSGVCLDVGFTVLLAGRGVVIVGEVSHEIKSEGV